MRLVDGEARLNFSHKGALADAPAGWAPWFDYPCKLPSTLLFGHWAALEGVTSRDEVVALDTGCVWGRTLTAMCLETREKVSVPAREHS